MDVNLSDSAPIYDYNSSKKQEIPKKNIYFCFIDYAKAFDYVDYNKLCKILQWIRVFFFFFNSFFLFSMLLKQ